MTSSLKEIEVTNFIGDVMHAEWMPDGERIAFVGREIPGVHVLVTVASGGGAGTVVHRFQTEHDFSGMTVSPDGRHLGFVAPATDGFYQVFRVPIRGGTPEQITTDPSNKTQPAWSPDGVRLAYTVWSYTSTFWLVPR